MRLPTPSGRTSKLFCDSVKSVKEVRPAISSGTDSNLGKGKRGRGVEVVRKGGSRMVEGRDEEG